MKEKYDKMWNEIVGLIGDSNRTHHNQDAAKKIWDDVVEDAWKYDDLRE